MIRTPILAALAAVVLLTGACSSTGASPFAPATPTGSASIPATYNYSEPVPTSIAPPPIQKGDFTIGLKTVSKHCFGSAGCNVTVEPTITYAGTVDTLSAYGRCNVTYTITGSDEGEVTNTAYGQGGTQFRIAQSILSTASASVTPKASVTDVSCS